MDLMEKRFKWKTRKTRKSKRHRIANLWASRDSRGICWEEGDHDTAERQLFVGI